MSYPYRGSTIENHAFRPVSGTQMHNSSYIHFDAQTRSKPLQTLIETHVSTPRHTQCPTPLHSPYVLLMCKRQATPGEGVGHSAATLKVDGFSKTKNINK
jgi:hypothetical protein